MVCDDVKPHLVALRLTPTEETSNISVDEYNISVFLRAVAPFSLCELLVCLWVVVSLTLAHFALRTFHSRIITLGASLLGTFILKTSFLEHSERKHPFYITSLCLCTILRTFISGACHTRNLESLLPHCEPSSQGIYIFHREPLHWNLWPGKLFAGKVSSPEGCFGSLAS